ncbi:MAG: 50S ribosomal protein L22 [Candidatus Saccharimonadales bacterium]
MTEKTIVKAYAKNITQAPRKVALIASLVTKRSVADALVILAHTPKRAAKAVSKVIESAKANAVNNHDLDAKSLMIKTISVSTGTRLKRYMPASRGRALPYQKVNSNILVEISGDVKPKKVAKKTETKTTAKKESK